jgi:hypothetical protein
MKTARDRFLESPHRAEWEKIATSDLFTDACKAALADYVGVLCAVSEPPATHYRVQGAIDVLQLLSELHATPQPITPPPKPPELQYHIGRKK